MDGNPLCTVCRAINFRALVFQISDAQVEQKTVDLGYLQDIIKRVELCRLCMLIVEAAMRINQGQPLRTHRGGELLKFSLRGGLSCYVNHVMFEEEHRRSLSINNIVVNFHPAVCFNDPGFPKVVFQASWDPDLDGAPLDNLVGSGRKVGKLIDTERVKGWLQQCEHEHGAECQNPVWLTGPLVVERLKVIDVQKRCIIKAPPHCRYIALSYVWGTDARAFRNTAHTARELEREFGLDRVDLPEVLVDTMAFAEQLGERYVWMDAYCILQDNEEDVAHFVGKMDLVYAGALVTIVVAAGENANSRLPGISTAHRDITQDSVKVEPNLVLMQSIAQGSWHHLQYSKWNSRGWTFQERLLSVRAVIFTSTQVYWECGKTKWAEETVFEPDEPNHDVFGHALGSVDEWDDEWPKFSLSAIPTYVTQFSTRNFTYQNDILPAFLGILHRIEQNTGERFHWAHRTSHFGVDLAWQYGNARRKDLCRVLSKDGRIFHTPYPSWTWLGWSGFRATRRFNRGPSAQESTLDFYAVRSDGTLFLIEPAIVEPDTSSDDDETQAKMQIGRWKGKTKVREMSCPLSILYAKLRNSSSGLSEAMPKIEESTHAALVESVQPAYDTGLLVFWTSHIKAPARPANNLDKYFIDKEGHSVVIRLSMSENSLEVERSEPGKAVDDALLNCIVVGVQAGILYTLIVEWIDEELNLASRVGEAEFQEDDWTKLEPEWRLVTLA